MWTYLWRSVVAVVHAGFPSETEVVTENDARSTSSFPYDDIDDMAVGQPLTSKAATAAASGDNDIHEGDLHQSAGKFGTGLITSFFTLEYQYFDNFSHCQQSDLNKF